MLGRGGRRVPRGRGRDGALLLLGQLRGQDRGHHALVVRAGDEEGGGLVVDAPRAGRVDDGGGAAGVEVRDELGADAHAGAAEGARVRCHDDVTK